jgi:hypothetical protein
MNAALGAYLVEASEETDASTGKLLQAWKITGPNFPGFTAFGTEGRARLETLAKRMNLAFEAGRCEQLTDNKHLLET